MFSATEWVVVARSADMYLVLGVCSGLLHSLKCFRGSGHSFWESTGLAGLTLLTEATGAQAIDRAYQGKDTWTGKPLSWAERFSEGLQGATQFGLIVAAIWPKGKLEFGKPKGEAAKNAPGGQDGAAGKPIVEPIAAPENPAPSFAQQAGIPDLIDLAKPSNVWGLDGRNLQSYFRRQGVDVGRIEPPKVRTSGKAEVFKMDSHPTISEVQYHPGGGTAHIGSYYKFTMKDGTKVKIIDPNTYVLRGGVEPKTTYFNQQGQRIEFSGGRWNVVDGK